jgi:hypothetical protein
LTIIDGGVLSQFTVAPLTAAESDWVQQIVAARWGTETIAVHDEVLRPAD